MRKASRYVSQAYDNAIASSGIKLSQFSLLATIYQSGAAAPTMRELADTMVMDRSTLGHNLRPLEREGFLRIKTDRKDSRNRRIHLTPKGRAKVEETSPLWRSMQGRFESALGLAATADLRGALLALLNTDLSTSRQNSLRN